MFHHRIMALCELPEGDAPLVVTDIFRRATNLACLHFLHTLHMGGTYVFHDDYENFCSANVSRVVASPSHVSRLLADLPIPDSPGIHEVRVVGGAIQPKLLTRFLKYFRVVTTTYGSTEAGPTTYRRFTEYDSDTSVGPFYSGVALEIVDDDHRPVKPCSEGQIRIRTGGQIHEYMDNIEASKQAFREGWFYPGDKGYYSEDGKLYVIGRIQDEFNAGGLKVNAAMIDRAIQDTDDVVDGMCFLETDEQGNETLATIVSLEPNSIIANVVEAAGKAILERDPDQYCLPRTYYQIGEIPRNPNGKIMRHLAAGLIEGLRPIARRDIDDVAYTVL
jgi:acyl-coenzyme A synthetase/AMP-(fatty) acid ligase